VTGLSRYRIIVIGALALGIMAPACARAAPTNEGKSTSTTSYPETWPADWPAVSNSEPPGEWSDEPAEELVFDSEPDGADWSNESEESRSSFLSSLESFKLRSSRTHGRHMGRGKPMVGTSWRNRPYYLGGELGALWITRSVDENVTRDADAFGGVFAGWDWDHYWGSELRFDWATPELKNTEARDANRTDSLFTWSYSYLYYPWGDTQIRPYWRCGIGNTHFDFPTDEGDRTDEMTLSLPLGFGVKYPMKRWLAARAELNDHLTVDDRLPTMHNVTFTLGLEWHFGAHPPSYWPWNPDRHIW
jgi:hypothetical protein